MTIKEVSQMYNISADTLRYYEKIGLIDPVTRNSNGIRNYQEADLKRIKFLKCMRLSGLSIDMLSQYIYLLQEGEHTLPQRKEILLKQRAEIVSKMNELQDTLDHLDHKIESYDDVIAKKEKEMMNIKMN